MTSSTPGTKHLLRALTQPKRAWRNAFELLPGTSYILLLNSNVHVHQFVDDYIRQRDFKSGANGHAEPSFGFIDQVAHESSNDTMLRDQLINVLLAGRDTTACCLSWTMYV